MIAQSTHRNQTTPTAMAMGDQVSPRDHALNTTKASPPTAPMRAPTRDPFHCTEGFPTPPFSGMRPLSAHAGTIGLMDELSPDPDEATHQLAAARSSEPTAWFDDLYRAAGD